MGKGGRKYQFLSCINTRSLVLITQVNSFNHEPRTNVLGQYARVSIQDGLYRIELPIAQLETISEDRKERIFTKRAEKNITFNLVRCDLDEFIETLQLSRTTTPAQSGGNVCFAQ